jgi:hypothetical protein
LFQLLVCTLCCLLEVYNNSVPYPYTRLIYYIHIFMFAKADAIFTQLHCRPRYARCRRHLQRTHQVMVIRST